jgi:hypothetical protein
MILDVYSTIVVSVILLEYYVVKHISFQELGYWLLSLPFGRYDDKEEVEFL